MPFDAGKTASPLGQYSCNGVSIGVDADGPEGVTSGLLEKVGAGNTATGNRIDSALG